MIQRRLEGVAADVVEEHVPFLWAGLSDLLIEVALLVVNGVIKTRLFSEPGALLGTTRNTDHATAFDFGDLASNRARSTRCTRHQYRFTGLGITQIEQSKVGREAGHTEHRQHHFRGGALGHRSQARGRMSRVYDCIILPAVGGLHHLPRREIRVVRLHDLRHAARAHGLTDLHRRQVTFAIHRPAALGRIKREHEVANQHLALAGFGNVRLDVLKMFGADHAHGALVQKPLSIHRYASLYWSQVIDIAL